MIVLYRAGKKVRGFGVWLPVLALEPAEVAQNGYDRFAAAFAIFLARFLPLVFTATARGDAAVLPVSLCPDFK